MTPKEEAKELVDKFLPFVDWNDLQDDYTNRDWAIRNAKRCALVAVDKIDLLIQKSTQKDDPYCNLFALEYWQEVKQEIEKL